MILRRAWFPSLTAWLAFLLVRVVISGRVVSFGCLLALLDMGFGRGGSAVDMSFECVVSLISSVLSIHPSHVFELS